MNAEKKQGAWLKVFCPDARCLSEAEVESLPKAQKEAMADKEGLWMEVFCPDGACATGPEHFWSPAESGESDGKGAWLKAFCPDDACLVEENTDLP